MNIILPIAILGGTGLIAAVILYIVARRFAVKEDERIAAVEAILPGANCGACGRKGCHDFASACCTASSLDGLTCPGAGADGMKAIARLLGFAATQAEVKKAFLLCNGGKCNRLVGRSDVKAPSSCLLARSLAYPAGFCSWGCLGCGDCVEACRFDALRIDTNTGLPVVDYDRCTGCGACAKVCPQSVMEIRPLKTGVASVRVSCVNKAKGAVARKMCAAACIGCGKCARTCPYGAITLSNNVAYIDAAKCTGCGACVEGCPTKAINLITTIH